MSDLSDTEHDALLGLQQQQQQGACVLQGLLLGARKVASRRSQAAALEPVCVLYSSPVLGLDSHGAATLQVVNDLLAGVKMPGGRAGAAGTLRPRCTMPVASGLH
jgi:hypothetical protein